MFNYQKFADLGWPKEKVDLVRQAVKARRQYGYDNLSPHLKDVFTEARKVERQATPAWSKNSKPVTEKFHYEWLSFYCDSSKLAFAKAHPQDNGDRSAWAIILEQEMRALRLYEPRLDQPDTVHRHKMNPLRYQLLNLALNLGSDLEIDYDEINEQCKLRFAKSWEPIWEHHNEVKRVFPVVPANQVDHFTQVVWDKVSQKTKEIYPSIA